MTVHTVWPLVRRSIPVAHSQITLRIFCGQILRGQSLLVTLWGVHALHFDEDWLRDWVFWNM
jgi:hypothetical protein